MDFGSISSLIQPSIGGDKEAREELLSELAEFLHRVAEQNMDPHLNQKMGVSDIVQCSSIRIIENLDGFQGTTPAELRAWIKQIVKRETDRGRRTYHSKKRDLKREQPIDGSSQSQPGRAIIDNQRTPSSDAIERERNTLFHQLLDELPEDYAQVIRLRGIEQLPFEQVGERMGRSSEAASKLWYRAMLKLEERLAESPSFDS